MYIFFNTPDYTIYVVKSSFLSNKKQFEDSGTSPEWCVENRRRLVNAGLLLGTLGINPDIRC